MSKPVGRRPKHYRRNRQRTEILLKGKISVNRYVERLRYKGEHRATRHVPHLAGGLRIVTHNVARQRSIDAFVKKDLYAIDSMRLSFACSRL
jgi:hypothetical protein